MSRAAADTWFAQRQDAFEGKLEARFNALDQIRWPQVLRTHTETAIPADGVAVAPDNLGATTGDNGDGWNALGFTIGGKWLCALEVNNYGDSQGHGCELVGWVRELSVLYRKVFKVFGHQQYRVTGWVEVLVQM